ncbi:MAG: hypothetical protein GWN41_07140 [Phycisphaerae bacterium]|nr:hypothetical protein [Phycisphaerae bacterium]
MRFGKDLQVRDNKAILALSKLSASAHKQGVESYAWIGTINRDTAQELFVRLSYLTGVVVDISSLSSEQQTEDMLRMFYSVCYRARRRLCLRLGECANSGYGRITDLIRSLPKDVGLIVPFNEYQTNRCRNTAFDVNVYGKRDITVELALTSCPTGPMLPDVRMDKLASLIIEAVLNGAKGFIVHANISDHYVPDSFNAISLYALSELADNPFQGTDVLWNKLCSKLYGEAGNEAMAALKLTESTNDLIFRMFGVPVLWDGSNISTMDVVEKRLKKHFQASTSAGTKEVLQKLLEPTDKTVERVRGDKETALWLISQSTAKAEAAAKINPTAELRALPEAIEQLRKTVLFWQEAGQAYLLAKIYATDGASSTRRDAEAALKKLSSLVEEGTETQDIVSMFKGTNAFVSSVGKWLQEKENTAELPRSFGRVKELMNKRQDKAAVEMFVEILRSKKFAAHLKKQNETIGNIASSLNAFGEPSKTLRIVRGGDGQWDVRKVGGRWCWVIGPKKPCLYLDVPGGALKKPADYVLSFEYFDKGDWKIYFHYDSDYPPEQKREYHPVEPLQLTNTGTWKKDSFVLTNCRFASSQNVNADMRFVSGTGACIRNIRLECK